MTEHEMAAQIMGHWGLLVAMARRIGRLPTAEAEDIAGTAVERAWEMHARIDLARLRSLLCIITRRLVIDYQLSARVCRAGPSLDHPTDDQNEPLGAFLAGDAHKALIVAQCADALALVGRLPTNQARCLTLYAVGYTYAELPSVTGLTLPAVRMSILRARRGVAAFEREAGR